MSEERLQKILAQAGVASRRAAEAIIVAGRVRVNGRVVTELGAKADARNDKIELDGRRLVPETFVYVALHKPRGVVATLSDPEGRPTVRELVKGIEARVFPVGRLDFATSGVLLLTNDGEFSNGLLHPRRKVPKTYVVKVQGVMSDADLERWATGIELEDGMTLPADVGFLRHEDGKTWFELTIREGRNQQVRRMGEATGFRVMRLARVAFAGITVERLRPGQWRLLDRDELLALREGYGVPKRLPRGDAELAAVAQESRTRAPVQRGAAGRKPPREPQGAAPGAKPWERSASGSASRAKPWASSASGSASRAKPWERSASGSASRAEPRASSASGSASRAKPWASSASGPASRAKPWEAGPRGAADGPRRPAPEGERPARRGADAKRPTRPRRP